MNGDLDWTLLAKYFAGEATRKEIDLVERWLESDPLNREQFESLESTWKASADRSVQWDVDRAWANVSARLGLGTSQESNRSGTYKPAIAPSRKYRGSARLLSTAAVVIFMALAAFIYTDFSYYKTAATGTRDKAVAVHRIMTGNGQRASFTMSDGTEVYLNSASSIRFPSKFEGSKRMVYLNGEAFFKVKHNDAMPFKVMITNGEVTDIGTEFNVKSWRGDGESIVTVKEGKVSFAAGIRGEKSVVYLTEKESAKLNEKGELSTPARTNVDRQLGWMKGNLYFENAPLEEVFRSLDRSYNFSCAVKDSSLLSLHLTAVFKGDNIKEVVNIISLALGFQYRISGNTCVFSARKTPGKKAGRDINSQING